MHFLWLIFTENIIVYLLQDIGERMPYSEFQPN